MDFILEVLLYFKILKSASSDTLSNLPTKLLKLVSSCNPPISILEVRAGPKKLHNIAVKVDLPLEPLGPYRKKILDTGCSTKNILPINSTKAFFFSSLRLDISSKNLLTYSSFASSSYITSK